MQQRHTDRERYFNEQNETVRKYVLPFINEVMPITAETSVLEIGCGEGGNLRPFLELGCKRVVGIDLSPSKISNANKYFEAHPQRANISFIAADIYKVADIGQFDLIVMRDTIEHIHDQERFMEFVKVFLKPEGRFFQGFPPWHNPFGGHQQICRSKFLSVLPYFHLLPVPLYKGILKLFGESELTINNLLEIKQTGISIERFDRILRASNYAKLKRTFYFINPNYEVKFGLKPRRQLELISSIPYLRNFLITTCFYVIALGDERPWERTR